MSKTQEKGMGNRNERGSIEKEPEEKRGEGKFADFYVPQSWERWKLV